MVVKRDEQRLKRPARSVIEKQDPAYSQADFVRDLEQVAGRRRELIRPPGPGSRRRTS